MLVSEFQNDLPAIFILTNSRSQPTAIARDKVFGYQHSDLRAWVAEKTNDHGALIIVGSHVKRSSDQIETLLDAIGMAHTSINTQALLDEGQRNKEIERIGAITENVLSQGKDMLVFTQRELTSTTESDANLQIGQIISLNEKRV